jgi:hypothetical protein
MAITTIEKCKRYLGISLTDTSNDDFINDLIISVQSTIETYCHRKFDVATYTAEQHNIKHKIFPKNFPIKSIDSIVRVDTPFMDTMPQLFEVANYRLFPHYIELIDYRYVTMTNKLQYVSNESSYVEITYTAGYDVIPSDLALAATKLVAIEYKDSRENRLGVEQEREGDVQYIYSKKDSEMPINISAVLDRYKGDAI